ncbi:MAG: hypothetical protein K0S11_366 [Gammaproteobacteria bacterium]|nr:hypothetical protein [Gammaproteobacteria bacterium]
MNTAVLHTKLGQNANEQRYAFEAAEAGLVQAEQALFKNKIAKCLLAEPIINVSQQPVVWWQQQCQGDFPKAKVYYVIEKLAFNPCVHLAKTKSRFVDFYRLSSFAIARAGGGPIILQTTFTRASKEICFIPIEQKLTLGRLSWCQLK